MKPCDRTALHTGAQCTPQPRLRQSLSLHMFTSTVYAQTNPGKATTKKLRRVFQTSNFPPPTYITSLPISPPPRTFPLRPHLPESCTAPTTRTTTTMLRRKPTALTISSEDIASFEESYLRKLAYARYLKTGEDPEGYFRNSANNNDSNSHGQQNERQQQRDGTGTGGQQGSTTVDPNDELKPLPGDKARIVRSREERIGVGGGVGTGAAGSGR
jgi:hypothetical protein